MIGPRPEEMSEAELEEQREFLLRSLDDLEAERAAGDVDDRDYGALRDGYTARAAAVLRALDARGHGAGVGAAAGNGAAARDGVGSVAGDGAVAGNGSARRDDEPAGGPGARRQERRPRLRTAAVAGSVAAFAIAAGLAVARASGQRLPGDTATGTVPNSRVAQELALAVQDFRQGDVIGAIRTYDRVLATDPTNAQALTYKGWLLRLAGAQAHDTRLIDEGLSAIQEAERITPSYADPHFFAGEILLRDKNDPKDAITEFQTYLADNPPSDMGPEVQGELQAARGVLATR